MEYFKVLVLMDGERIKVTPEQFRAVEIAKDRGDKHMMVGGNMLALSSISRSEDSTESIPGLALPGTTDLKHKHEPQYITEEDGHVFVNALLIQVKVPRKYYEKWLSGRSLVHIIEQDGAWVIVAMTHVPCKDCGITRDDALECTEEDYARFRPGWRRGGYGANV